MAADAEDLYAAVSESVQTVGQWTSWCHVGYSKPENFSRISYFQSTWQSQEAFEFAVLDYAGAFVGGVGLSDYDRVRRSATLGYWTRQSRQRDGIAREAVTRVLRFGFEALRLSRIKVIIAVANLASRKVTERAGGCFTCVIPDFLAIGNAIYSAAVYECHPTSSWRALANRAPRNPPATFGI
jgi:ribosomal-protein-serine acetyltransferase